MSADAPQGLFTFTGGILPTAVLGAEVSQTHSMTPDLCFVDMAFDPTTRTKNGVSLPSKNGDVILEYAGKKITLKDCTIDFVEMLVGNEWIWRVTILDRRYRWRDGAISGRYNVRYRNGTDVRPETKTSLQTLAVLCLRAMGETHYDLGPLIDNAELPEVDWFYDNPKEALVRLCEDLGFRAIYDWSKDQVRIVDLGQGAALDLALPYEKDSLTYNPPELPGTLVVVCGPSQGQYDFATAPKGMQYDGRIVDLDELIYRPAIPQRIVQVSGGGVPIFGPMDISTGTRWDTKFWNCIGAEPTYIDVRPPYYRHLALDSVYKWYQIVPPKSIPGLNKLRGDGKGANLETFPKWDDSKATFVWQIELLAEQNDTILYLADRDNHAFDALNKIVSLTPLNAWIYGNYARPLLGNVFIDDTGLPGSGIKKLNPQTLTSPQQIEASLGIEEAAALDALLPDRLMARVAATGFYTGGFQIDSQHAMVKFDQMVYQFMPFKNPAGMTDAINSDGSPISPGEAILPACLFLRTAFRVRDPKTRALVCYERRRVLDANNPIVRYFQRDDLTYKITFRPKGQASGAQVVDNGAGGGAVGNMAKGPLFWNQWTTEDNKKAIDQACDFYLDQQEKYLRTETPRTVLFIGLIPQRLDGAIRQITWTIGDRGAHTYVARDTEILHIVRDYREVRMRERIRAQQQAKQQPDEPIPASQTDYSGLI